MPSTSHTPRPIASIPRRAAALLAMLATSLLVAAGCSGDDVAAPAQLDEAGALRWLPADTWLVATGDLSAKRLDRAVDTLGRLPIWALVEGELPASDGEGLRAALLEQVASQARGEDSDVDADQLERAFGDRVGLAVFEDDFARLSEEDESGVAAWVLVDDESLALDAMLELFDGMTRQGDHDGVDYYEVDDRSFTFLVRDEVLLWTTSPGRIEQLIDVREGDDPSLADDEDAVAMIDAGIGEAVAGAALGSEPLIDALAQLADEQQGAGEGPEAALGDVLSSDTLDELVPDWMAGSVTIDDVGLRMRASWSDPRELADPSTSARELVERMPGDAPIVSGTVMDGSALARLQEAWAEVADATGLDLRDDADCAAQGDMAWGCRLAVEAALTILEDGDLATALDEQPDSATVLVQDLLPLVTASMQAGGGATQGQTTPAERWLEVATTATTDLDWTAPEELTAAMRDAGLQVTATDDGGVRVKVAPRSPMAGLLRQAQRDVRAGTGGVGVPIAPLLTPQGLVLQPDVVDGVSVFGFPQDAPSTVAPALRGEGDQLGDLDDYQRVVDAVDPPETVGSWSWVYVAQLVEDLLTVAAADSPDIARVVPTVRNNLSDVPGMLSWTTREEFDGRDVGVAEAVLPVLE